MQKKKRCRPFPNEISFYVVGNKRLENELIASYLTRETGNNCFLLEDIKHIPGKNPNNDLCRRILLWNCQKNDMKNLLAELKAYNTHKQGEHHIILFNVPTDLEFNKKLVMEGIQGFFYEHDSLDNFMKGVLAVIEGKLWLSRDMMTKCILEGTDKDKSSKSIREKLSKRQIEIIALIAVGATNDEIADRLCISSHTVKTHLYRIFNKINVPNRVQAALWAAKNL